MHEERWNGHRYLTAWAQMRFLMKTTWRELGARKGFEEVQPFLAECKKVMLPKAWLASEPWMLPGFQMYEMGWTSSRGGCRVTRLAGHRQVSARVTAENSLGWVALSTRELWDPHILLCVGFLSAFVTISTLWEGIRETDFSNYAPTLTPSVFSLRWLVREAKRFLQVEYATFFPSKMAEYIKEITFVPQNQEMKNMGKGFFSSST